MLRVAGSLKLGWVTASLFVQKLQSYPRQNELTRTLQEYGRLVRTLYILRWYNDEDQRRRIQRQLNKGEALENERDRYEKETRETRERHQTQENRWVQEVDGLRQEIKEKARAHTLLDKALAGEKAKTTALNGQIGKLEQENQKLQQELEGTREANETVTGQKTALEQSLAEMRNELAETKTAIERLKQERVDETEAQVGKIIELLNNRLGES